MIVIVAVDELAKAIHESRFTDDDHQWEKLPKQNSNPQRYYARRAAKAVIELLGGEPGIVSETFELLFDEADTAKPVNAAISKMMKDVKGL